MSNKKWDVVAACGKYTKNGESKVRWMNVGAVFESGKGLSLKLDSLPLSFGEDGLWLKLFEPRPSKPGPTSMHDDDEAPFF